MTRASALIFVVLTFPLASWAQQFPYIHDDGIPENAVGVTEPGTFDLLWLNRFFAVAPGRRINSISLAFGFAGGHGLNIGSPIEVLLYDDPSGGDPRDATLLRHIQTTVQTLDFAAFNTYTFEPTTINGVFHVGVVLRDQPSFTFPAAIDLTIPHVTGASTMGFTSGPMNVSQLSTIPSGQFGTAEILLGVNGNWLVRATGVAVPEPIASLPLASVALIALRHRSSRR